VKKSVFLQCLALNIIGGKETRPTKISIKKKQVITIPFFKGKLIANRKENVPSEKS